MTEPWASAAMIEYRQLVLDSHQHCTEKQLFARDWSPKLEAKALFLAPFVVVLHGTQHNPLVRLRQPGEAGSVGYGSGDHAQNAVLQNRRARAAGET